MVNVNWVESNKKVVCCMKKLKIIKTINTKEAFSANT